MAEKESFTVNQTWVVPALKDEHGAFITHSEWKVLRKKIERISTGGNWKPGICFLFAGVFISHAAPLWIADLTDAAFLRNVIIAAVCAVVAIAAASLAYADKKIDEHTTSDLLEALERIGDRFDSTKPMETQALMNTLDTQSAQRRAENEEVMTTYIAELNRRTKHLEAAANQRLEFLKKFGAKIGK